MANSSRDVFKEMFLHKGKSRNFIHNIGIATLLSFVAGIVNVVGFLSIKQLTTNVTGHFAFMVEEALRINFHQAFFYFIYIFFFFLGAFFSNFTIEVTQKLSDKNIYFIPVIYESLTLFVIALLPMEFIQSYPNFIACGLLFAMGLQNSLVTIISNAVVRTTHLTGLFTDLGIEFSQLFFYKKKKQNKKLISSIKLRLSIVASFFMGGILAGICYPSFQVKTLLIASALLLIGLATDIIVLRIRLKRSHHKL